MPLLGYNPMCVVMWCEACGAHPQLGTSLDSFPPFISTHYGCATTTCSPNDVQQGRHFIQKNNENPGNNTKAMGCFNPEALQTHVMLSHSEMSKYILEITPPPLYKLRQCTELLRSLRPV